MSSWLGFSLLRLSLVTVALTWLLLLRVHVLLSIRNRHLLGRQRHLLLLLRLERLWPTAKLGLRVGRISHWLLLLHHILLLTTGHRHKLLLLTIVVAVLIVVPVVISLVVVLVVLVVLEIVIALILVVVLLLHWVLELLHRLLLGHKVWCLHLVRRFERRAPH